MRNPKAPRKRRNVRNELSRGLRELANAIDGKDWETAAVRAQDCDALMELFTYELRKAAKAAS